MLQRDLMVVFNEFVDNYIKRLEESTDYKVIDKKRFRAALGAKLFTDKSIFETLDNLFWNEVFSDNLSESVCDWWGVEYEEGED